MIELVPLRPEDEDRILGWRNSPEVARFMYRDWPISPDEHHAWFAGALVDTTRAIHRLVVMDDIPAGLSSLTAFDEADRSCEWGGYLAPEIEKGAGIGREVLRSALSMAFDELGLDRVYVEVVVTNTRALALYESVGFERVELLRGRALQSAGPVDAHRLVLIRPV